MKKLFLLCGVLALIGLSGCSTISNTASTASDKPYDDRFDSWVDGKKVADIENAAKNRNVRVMWITYPSKNATATP